MEELLIYKNARENAAAVREGEICENCHLPFADSPPMYARTCEDCKND
ncbi:hypothetical protein [Halobacillus sp. A5]|nr:hypothetical protein [Halobacillus sp. A5]MCP3027874.1 hypothetical protein [Halobacillus sp. A5]